MCNTIRADFSKRIAGARAPCCENLVGANAGKKTYAGFGKRIAGTICCETCFAVLPRMALLLLCLAWASLFYGLTTHSCWGLIFEGALFKACLKANQSETGLTVAGSVLFFWEGGMGMKEELHSA